MNNYYYDPEWEMEQQYKRATKNLHKFRRKPRTMKDILLMLLGCVLYPFYKLVLGIIWLWNAIVYEDIETGSNGILGPGFRRYYTTRVAWGKISFILLIIVVIVIGIMYIYH